VLTRRHALSGLMATGAGALAASAVTAKAASDPRPAILPGAPACILTPQAVEGPFYFDPRLERSDITEGKTGVPLTLSLQLVEAGTCLPLAGARVDVWHADAGGSYSGYENQGDARTLSTRGETFLRGTQLSGDSGEASFRTLYPGWYAGRTAHVHFKVFLDAKNVLTGQLYFPDALSEFIFRNIAPYSGRGRERDTINATDGVLRDSGGGRATFCNIKEEADHYRASLTIGVDRSATPAVDVSPPPPPNGGRFIAGPAFRAPPVQKWSEAALVPGAPATN
jgi:protocatechuate 3,4-dioxygenase beta subunit